MELLTAPIDDAINLYRRFISERPFEYGIYTSYDFIAPWTDLFDEAAALLPPRSGIPIVLDLDGDGVETTFLIAGAYFDHDKNGFAERTGWAGGDDGLLAWDRNADGVINDGGEVFNTTMPDGTPAENGFQVLATFDDNGDGRIDTNDAIWSQLKIWQDIDGDGYSASDELFTLDELSIRSINTAYDISDYVDANGNEHRQVGSYTRTDGTTLTATDVWFRTDKACTIASEWLYVPDDIAALPDLQGFGNTYDLHQAMVRDATGTLKVLIEQFAHNAEPATRNVLLEQILFRWTGSDAIDPASRGGLIDARRLSVLEAFFGETYEGTTGPDPIQGAVPFLERSYKGVFEMYYAQLMAQTHLKDLYDMINYAWDETSQSIKGDLGAVVAAVQNALAIDEAEGRALLGEFSRTIYGLQAREVLDFTMGFRSVFATHGEELAWIIDSAGRNVISGVACNDNLYSWEANDAITGGKGNDSLYAGTNFDTVVYGKAGADYVAGAEGNDILNGGEGNDQLFGWGGNDILEGGHSNDYIDGGVGNDMVVGGTGKDVLFGGEGSDTYLFNPGDGQDTIYEYDATGTGIDTITFGPGITKDDLIATRKDYDLVLSMKNSTDSITLQYWYYGNEYKIERFEFADNTVFTMQNIEQMAVIRGTSGNDYLYDFDTNDTIQGGAGNDYIQATAGGSDTYLFNPGDGQDTIYEYDATGTNIDTVTFGPGITKDDLTITRRDYDLIVSPNSTDSIALQYWYCGSEYKIENFQFAEGGTVTTAEIEDRAIVRGTDRADYLTGFDNGEVFVAGKGDDCVCAYEGNDVITGGPGCDYLDGGSGSDLYRFSLEDGSDIICDCGYDGAIDGIIFDMDVPTDSIAFFRDYTGLSIAYGSKDRIMMADQDTAGIEKVQITGGFYLTDSDINTLIQQITAYAAVQGVVLNNVDDVRNNNGLMNIIVNAWHQ